jgi:hypothetical protein
MHFPHRYGSIGQYRNPVGFFSLAMTVVSLLSPSAIMPNTGCQFEHAINTYDWQTATKKATLNMFSQTKYGSQAKAYIKTITTSEGDKKINWTALLNACEFYKGSLGTDGAEMGDISMVNVNRASLFDRF